MSHHKLNVILSIGPVLLLIGIWLWQLIIPMVIQQRGLARVRSGASSDSVEPVASLPARPPGKTSSL
jgi:hypothetical protein